MLTLYPAFLEFKELMIILVVAVILFGPNKIPEIARGLGSAVRKMKEATEDIKQEIMNPVKDIDPTKEIRESIANLDPTEDIKKSIDSFDPTKDIERALEDPINKTNTIVDDSGWPTTEDKNTDKSEKSKNTKDEILLTKTEVEVAAEKELNQGGSVSR